MTTTAPTRPVLRYHGGKWRLAPWIISHFPPHRVYVEPFGGAASVLMRKQRASLVEVYNDADGEIVDLFRVLRDPATATALRESLRLTPFARAEFVKSYEPCDDVIEQARRTVIRAFMGFGSDSASGARTGFRANGNRQNNHPAKDWSNYPNQVDAFTARLAGVVIECRSALDMIAQHDALTTLFYVDPPYPHDARSDHTTRTGKGYRHELNDDDHRHLAEAISNASGMVVLSGYACDLYDTLFQDWERREWATMADGGAARTEVLWLNPACSRALRASTAQLSLTDDAVPQFPRRAVG